MLSQLGRVRRQEIRDMLHDSRPVSGAVIFSRTGGLVREAMKSVAHLAIFPVQDILGLDNRARMNIPGKASGNWKWRLAENALTKKLAAKLSHEAQTFNRLS